MNSECESEVKENKKHKKSNKRNRVRHSASENMKLANLRSGRLSTMWQTLVFVFDKMHACFDQKNRQRAGE